MSIVPQFVAIIHGTPFLSFIPYDVVTHYGFCSWEPRQRVISIASKFGGILTQKTTEDFLRHAYGD